MSDTQLVTNKQSDAADTIEIFYTNNTDRDARVNAFTASNSTLTSQTYEAFIYSSTDAEPDLPDAIIPQTIVVRDKSDHGAGIVNMIIPAGSTLRIKSSNANGLNFNVAGLEQE